MRRSHSRVLFLCTGNYYRSRFAEILFNHLAHAHALPWRADSRALDIDLGRRVNQGPISTHTVKALHARGIPLPQPLREPSGCLPEDLTGADLVIALKEAEHRPLLRRKFPRFVEQVTYWHVHDLDAAQPAETLWETERLVTDLVQSLMRPAL